MKKKVYKAALTAMAFSLEAEQKKVKELEYIIDRINEDIRHDRDRIVELKAENERLVAQFVKPVSVASVDEPARQYPSLLDGMVLPENYELLEFDVFAKVGDIRLHQDGSYEPVKERFFNTHFSYVNSQKVYARLRELKPNTEKQLVTEPTQESIELPDAGEDYDLLQADDVLKEGDEEYSEYHKEWDVMDEDMVGERVGDFEMFFRRRKEVTNG